MHKFKFQPPREPRNSLQPAPRHDHVSVIFALDKCTQIVRQDRLWLRNQIKSNNHEVLAIFKTYSKVTQLQHLQIKLRKYMQGVKSRIKQEQLAKFRETLQHHNQTPMPQNQSNWQNQHGISQQLRKHSENKSIRAEEKGIKERVWRRYEEPAIKGSQSKQHLKSGSSCELSKTTQFKPNKSVQHKQNSQMVMSSSLRHFQELLKYKCSQEVIEQRESENVTSARLGRQQEKTRPLQQISYSSQLNQYRWEKEIEKEKLKNWDFQNKARQALYQQKSRNEPKENFQEDMQESIMDKHFIDDSQKASPRPLPTFQNFDFKSHTFSSQAYQEEQSFHQNPSPRYQNSEECQNITQSQPALSNFPESRPNSDRNEENLFTPLELLNQCRNFLRSREYSTKKDVDAKVEESYKPKENHQEIGQCLFTRNNFKEVQLSDSLREKQVEKIKEVIHEQQLKKEEEKINVEEEEEDEEEEEIVGEEKEEESGFSFPQARNTEEISQVFNSPKEEEALYPHFETFANCTLKSPFQKALSPPQLQQTYPVIPKNFSIEDFLQDLMEVTEMSPFTSIEQLQVFISTHTLKQLLSHVFSSSLSGDKGEELCITKLAEQLNQLYNKEYGNYFRNDDAINGVYDLLDIDQKGHIVREDVDSFLGQIQEAEVNNFQEVSQQLLRLFEGADFSNEQRLTYWHFYLVKNSDEFEHVSQLLSEFQFQIQRE